MIVRHLSKVHELVSVLEQPTAEMRALRPLLTEGGKYPSRCTWERRLGRLPERLPGQIGCLGRELVAVIEPWMRGDGEAAALDSTLLRASGGVWRRKRRESGEVPHPSIDTEARWTKSGWHGWVYGMEAAHSHRGGGVWIPLAARVTPTNTPDSEVALQLLGEAPAEVRYVLGDTHHNAPEVRGRCEEAGRILVATRRGRYPHADDGAEVRRSFHQLRSRAIENFDEQFEGIFDGHAGVPTKGLANTTRHVLGAVFAYQLALLYRHEHGQPLRVGLKPFLKAA